MKRNDFEKELDKRLAENKKLSTRQFLPKSITPLASFVSLNLFYVVMAVSFLVTSLLFGLLQSQLLRVSRVILLLSL